MTDPRLAPLTVELHALIVTLGSCWHVHPTTLHALPEAEWECVQMATRVLAHLPQTQAEDALVRIADMTKGEPKMSGGTLFPYGASGHLIGRIHNITREAFGGAPLTILNGSLSELKSQAERDGEVVRDALDATGLVLIHRRQGRGVTITSLPNPPAMVDIQVAMAALGGSDE